MTANGYVDSETLVGSFAEEIEVYKSNRHGLSEDGTSYASSDFENQSMDGERSDNIFLGIKKSVIDSTHSKDLIEEEGSVASLDRLSSAVENPAITGHNSLAYGFVPKGCYEHPIKSGAILGICHNPRYRQFLFLDPKGISSWKYDNKTGPSVSRQLNYPPYQYRVYSNLVYAQKHNVYFCLGRDFSLKILNKQFEETYTVEANLRNVMFLLYNPYREELITGGVGGSKVWQFVQVVEDKGWTEVKAMSNYKLQHKYTLKDVGGGWVKRVEMNNERGHLYCCSETDLFAYNLNTGDEIFSIKRAHDMSITSCIHSKTAELVLTSSMDSTVKCWIVNGGLVHVFHCHTKPVTQILVHPDNSSLVLTCSEDCSIKVLSLDTLDVIYSITVSSDGIKWMGLTHENMLYACSPRQLTLWNLNHFVDFFAPSRSKICQMKLQSAKDKATRLLTVGDDSCVRLYSIHQMRHLSTVLPMPCISPLEAVKCVAYLRELNLVYCLINQSKLWVYTTRTDPACRIAQWDLSKIQAGLINKTESADAENGEVTRKEAAIKKVSPYRAVADIHFNVEVCPCTVVATLNNHILLHSDEGWVGTIPSKFLLIGLSDGRILFMDPFIRGLLHCDFRANKDAIVDIKHDRDNQQLITQCSRNELCIVQIWSLPTLYLQHELCLYQDIQDCARIGDLMMYGYGDGTVSFHELEEVDEDNINRKTNQIKNIEELKTSGLVHKKYEHKGAILSIDGSKSKRVFMSCSTDSSVKIWLESTCSVAADIFLNDTLSTAAFLNSAADIAFGFLNNLYMVRFKAVCPHIDTDDSKDETISIIAESDIYEDPSITHEGVLGNPEPVKLKTYLKPYELDITKDFLEAANVVPQAEQKEETDEASEILSNAPSAAYESPFSTPRLSRIDVFTPHPIQWDLISSHSGRVSAIGSSVRFEGYDTPQPATDQEMFDILDVTNPDHAEFYLPMFGNSPGGTPTISSATITDSRSDLDDLSDFEFGTEESEGEEKKPEKKETKKKTKKTSHSHAAASKKKKQKTKQLELILEPDDSESPTLDDTEGLKTKYGIDNMEIDVASLMKQSKKKGKKKQNDSTVATPTVTSAEQEMADMALKQSFQAGAAELSSKKKKRAGAPAKRAPAGKKQSSDERSALALGKAKIEQPKVEETTKAKVQAVKKDKVKTVGGDLMSGLIPSSSPAQKKVPQKRRGQLIDAKKPETPPVKDPNKLLTQLEGGIPVIVGDDDDDEDDDVELSNFMKADDDLECGSATDWNPKFNFEPGQGQSPDLSKSGKSRNYSALSSDLDVGSPDARISFSVQQKTSALSQRLSDIDGLSIDDLNNIIEDQMTPQPSESIAGESIAMSGASPARLPSLLPELDITLGQPSQSDALSQWLIGSMPRVGSAFDSEIPTRPTTVYSEIRPVSRDISRTQEQKTNVLKISSFMEKKMKESKTPSVSRKSKPIRSKQSDQIADGTRGRPNTAKVGSLTHSKMLGYRIRRPHTAPSPHYSYEDLQEAFDEALMKYQGHTDINQLFKANLELFDEDWQEKVIERHKLLRMQKEIRAKSAVHKRSLLQQLLVDRRHALLGHRYCDGLIQGSTTPTKPDVSAPPSRVNTAVARPVISVNLTTSKMKLDSNMEDSAMKPLKEKAELTLESQVQYRHRINEPLCQQLHSTIKVPEKTHEREHSVIYDPRRPDSVKNTPSRSIPTRCSTYVLIKRKKSNDRPTSPTPLEKQLLKKRFPAYADRVLPKSTQKSVPNSSFEIKAV